MKTLPRIISHLVVFILGWILAAYLYSERISTLESDLATSGYMYIDTLSATDEEVI
jgi:hypothetical protein